MDPMPGPPRITLHMTTGRSAPAIHAIASLISEIPQLDELVMARTPVHPAP